MWSLAGFMLNPSLQGFMLNPSLRSLQLYHEDGQRWANVVHLAVQKTGLGTEFDDRRGMSLSAAIGNHWQHGSVVTLEATLT